MHTPDTAPANALRDRIARPSSLGSICMLPNPDCAELMAGAGFDWLLLDLQHGLVDRRTIVDMIRALDVSGTPALVRVSANSADQVGWVLDAGAQGVVAPMIDNAAQARAFVSACRYGPAGVRSWGPMRAIMRGNADPRVGDMAVACAMIETQEAMRNLDAIVSVEGLDLILIGQSDLALSFGLRPGEGIRNAEHVSRLQRIADACARVGMPVIVNCHALEDLPALRGMGFRHLMMSSDLALLRRAAVDLCTSARTVTP